MLTEANAERVTGDMFLLNQTLPMNLAFIVEATGTLLHEDCLEGSATLTQDDQDRPLSASFNDCVLANSSNFHVIANGALRYAYGAAEMPESIDAGGFSLTMTDDYTASNGPFIQQTIGFTGEMNIEPAASLTDTSFEEVNGTLALSLRVEQSGEEQTAERRWTLEDYSQILVEQGSDTLARVAGRVTLAPVPGGYITLTTHEPVSLDIDGSCPTQGDITAEGGEGSSLNLSVIDDDDILITLNGVQEHYTCAQFQEWVNESMDLPDTSVL